MFYLFVFCVLDTPLQGMEKRELDDDLVPSQLWIIAPSTPSGAYTFQNANGRSYATIDKGGFPRWRPCSLELTFVYRPCRKQHSDHRHAAWCERDGKLEQMDHHPHRRQHRLQVSSLHPVPFHPSDRLLIP